MKSQVHLESDAFILKLETAGISNNNCLSDEEVSRGRALLSRAQTALRDPNLEHAKHRTTLSLTEHISRLSIAVAPHKSLPPEILEHIFLLTLPEGAGYETELPPKLSEAPWVLGRVCSSWRRLSRSIHDLWGMTSIFLYDTARFPFGYPDPRVSLEKLKCAAQILPDVSDFRLSVDYSEDQAINATALCPFVGRVNDLDWKLRASNTNHPDPIRILPPGSFSQLQKLAIKLDEPEPNTGYPITSFPNLFGGSSQLEELTLRSNTPDFLLIDIPWNRLHSFALVFETQSMDDLTRPIWLDLCQSNTFQSMELFRDLSLSLSKEFISMALSLDFPWERLTSLYISWHDDDESALSKHDSQLLIQTLQKCPALIDLTFSGCIYPHVVTWPTITLPSLEKLSLSYNLPTSIILSLSFAGNIRSLNLYTVTLQDFFHVLRQSPCLVDLTCWVTESVHKDTRNIVLPHLESMDLTIPYPFKFPLSLLSSCSLLSLQINIQQQGEFDFIEHIVDFIVHSDIKLQEFSCNYYRSDLPFPLRSPDSGPSRYLMALLEVLNCCSSVIISQIILPHTILDMIASGILLPCVEDLWVYVDDAEAFIRMLKRRVESEHSQFGRLTLQWASGRILPSIGIEKRWPELEELERMYGIRYNLR